MPKKTAPAAQSSLQELLGCFLALRQDVADQFGKGLVRKHVRQLLAALARLMGRAVPANARFARSLEEQLVVGELFPALRRLLAAQQGLVTPGIDFDNVQTLKQTSDAVCHSLSPRAQRFEAALGHGTTNGRLPELTAQVIGPVGGDGHRAAGGFVANMPCLPAFGPPVSDLLQDRFVEV